MEVLRYKSRSMQVKLAQRLINIKADLRIRLVEDGVFGRLTLAAVKEFQRSAGLIADGVVGMAVWRALGVFVEVRHRIDLWPQPTNGTCWSAAATMLLGTKSSIGPNGARVYEDLEWQIDGKFGNIENFAKNVGLKFFPPQSWSIDGITHLLRKGPIAVFGKLLYYADNAYGHVVVFASIFGSGSAKGTMVHVYDPRPVGVGSVYGVFYSNMMGVFPLATMYILQKEVYEC